MSDTPPFGFPDFNPRIGVTCTKLRGKIRFSWSSDPHWLDWKSILLGPDVWTVSESVSAAVQFMYGRREGSSWIPGDLIGVVGLQYGPDTNIEEVIEKANAYEFVAYGTFWHTDTHPEINVFLPLQKPVTAAEYPQVWDTAASCLGGRPNRSTRHPDQFWSLPCLHPDRERFAFARTKPADALSRWLDELLACPS